MSQTPNTPDRRYLVTFSLTPAQLGQLLPVLTGYLSPEERSRLVTEITNNLWKTPLSQIDTVQIERSVLNELFQTVNQAKDTPNQ